jgi:spore maturation protein CgeB
MFSQRNIFKNALFRCPLYEFEDIICQIDSVELLAPQPKNWFNLGFRIANNRLLRHSSIALNPGIPKTKLKNKYDLLFAVCGYPKDLLTFDTVKNWKDCCKTSICLVDEMWVKQLPEYECFLKILSKFDYIVLYYSQSVKAVRQIIGDKCFYLPPGVDAILFCPYPDPPKRVIDVYSLGRRSEITHMKLLKMAMENRIYYVYDSIAGNSAINTNVHRFLVASTAKRSRFFLVNPGLIDEPEIRGGQIEIPNRYFEGAASGCIMLGEIPKNDEYKKLFGWPNAVIHLPFGSDNIDSIMNELDKEPERQEEIRKNNVVGALLRHDWVYRWESILKISGLEPLPALFERKQRLRDLSNIVEKVGLP